MAWRPPPAAALAACLAGATASRGAFWAAACAASGASWPDLALRYDGQVYLALAKSLPRLYLDAPAFFPTPVTAEYFTGWFPLYPALIRGAAELCGDARAAALGLSVALSAAAAALTARLAARTGGRRPWLAGALALLWPPSWLAVGSLACVEPLFVCCALAAVLAALEDRPWLAAAACAAGVLAQKSGFLLPAFALAAAWTARGPSGARRLAPVLLAAIPAAALQLWLWRAFGDPLINARVQRDIFGGSLFSWPLAALVRGALAPSPFGPMRSALIPLAVAGYGGLLAHSWWAARREEAPLRAWLGIALAFHLCLDGFWAFHSLPRLLLVAAPAAIALAERRLPEGRLLLWLSPALVLVPFLVAVLEFAQADAFGRRAWGEAHYAAASRLLR